MFQFSLSPYFSIPCENQDCIVLYIDEVILQRTGATDYYFTHDYRYSVTSLTNSAGSIVESYDYKVYGQRTASGSGLTDVGYTGQRHDAETGLMYFKNRYYSTSMGQFVTRDPLGYVDGLSMYLGYFGGQGNDPLGLDEAKAVKPKIKLVVAPSAVKDSLKVKSDNPDEPSVTYDSEVEAYNKNIDKFVGVIEQLKKLSDKSKVKKTKFKFDGAEIEADQFVIKIQELKIELIKLNGSTNEEIIKDFARVYMSSGADSIVLLHTHTWATSSGNDIMLLGNLKDSDAISFKSFNKLLNENLKKLLEEQKIEKMTKTASFTFNTCLMTKKEADALKESLGSKEVRYSKTIEQPAFPSFSYTKDGKKLTKAEIEKEKGFFSLYFNIDGGKIKLDVVK